MNSRSLEIDNGSIGVIDSGVGGLTVLDALRRRLPRASLSYVGDIAYAPYGERRVEDVLARVHRIVAHLVESGMRTVVVACNTATVLAIASLRERWPDVTFIGVEPGVKPAVALTRTGRIAIMTTSATARSARLRHLIDAHAAHLMVHVEACPGLASAIERHMGDDDAAIRDALAPHADSIRRCGADTVVLGCTHYPFVADLVQEMLGASVTLVETSTAVADRAAAVIGEAGDEAARLHIATTGASSAISTLLSRCKHLEPVAVAPLSI